MSTIQPTPPSSSTAPGPATTVARITSGAQALSNTRPGGTVQVQVTSVAPGGQVTVSAPGGEITLQTASSGGERSASQASSQGAGQSSNPSRDAAAEQASGRTPAALKPGDIYTLRAGPRGSDTVSLAPQRAAAQAPSEPAPPPPPRAEGSVPARLVPGAVTTATIIPRPGESFTPPPLPQPAPASPSSQGQARPTPPPGGAPTGQAPAPQGTPQAQGQGQGQVPPPSTGSAPAAPTIDTAATNLASLARSGTGALLRTALQAARAITDGAIRQPPAPGPATATGQNAAANPTASAPQAQPPTTTGGAAALPNTPPRPPGVGQYAPPSLAQAASTSTAAPGQPSAPATPPRAAAAAASTTATVNPTATTSTMPTPSPPTTSAAGNHPGQTGTPSSPTTSPSTAAATGGTGGGAAASQSTNTSAAAGAGGNPATIATGATSASNLVERFSQIQRIDLRIVSVQHPGATPATAATANTTTGGAVVAGTVIGLSRSGQPILGTPQGLMTVAGRGDLPPGSRVEIEILPRSTQNASGQAVGPPPAPLGHLARHWETLDQAIRLLETANPSAANQITQNHVARPGPQLTAAIALFITAVRGGDFRAWIGESNARALEMARGGLGSTLREEFSTMQRASEPNDGGWRGFFIPFMDDGQLNQVRFFLHQENDGSEDGDGDGTDRTRFVVDLSLSQLGDLQIDGAVQPRTVDLLIRTRDALPEHMRREIREIFTTTLARTGIEGQLAFRIQKTFPTLPIEELHGYQDSPTSDLHI